jgi:hypothetical protein
VLVEKAFHGDASRLPLKVEGPALPVRRSGMPVWLSSVNVSVVPSEDGRLLTTTARGLAQEYSHKGLANLPQW